ncbi:MAG: DUF885 domain-containing protein [Sphingobacteriales bacterium]|nr:MAG: DUF885 domain-containing protein [Sphingobacteriales bacterium]
MRFFVSVTAVCTFLLLAQSNTRAQAPAPAPAPGAGDKAFEAFKGRFVEQLWKLYPGWAGSAGYHKYDDLLILPTPAQRNTEIVFAKRYLDSVQSFVRTRLGFDNAIDGILISNQLRQIEWNHEKYKSHEWNPAQYNVGERIAEILNGNYAPLDKRLMSIKSQLTKIPAYYEAAKISIRNPTTEHTQLAIDQNLGSVSIFEKDLVEAVNKSGLSSDDKKQMTALSERAVTAIKSYAKWLQELKNPEPKSFRLERELYEQKFEFDIQSGYNIDQLYQKAVGRKQELHGLMTDLSRQLWPKYMGNAPKPNDSLEMIRQVIDKISLNHTTPDSFQAAIEKQIPELIAFVKKKNLIYLDPSKPLVVRREPDYMAGVAGASISAPGPYDKGGNTYYNVGSLSGWEADRAESYLREYNNYTLQILNIHEAIPGHYTQLVYSNQSPSLIKSIFGNGAMVEGWAVYTELMMLENGYGNNNPEMWLMYYKWNLRSTGNTILDYSVHLNNMSKEDALKFLTRECFQQQAEAEGKWRRATLTQVQLTSYFNGFMEIYDLREKVKKEKGESFDLKKFHEQFLSHGSVPVRYIERMVLSRGKR